MANLSEIIVRKNQNDEQWKAQKQAERENAAAMQDAGMEEISSNPDAYARYLEIQGDNPLYSAGNIALAMVQNPNITQFGTVERWKTLGRSVPEGERGKGVQVFSRASFGKGYSLVSAYDISQTTGREIKKPVLQDGGLEFRLLRDEARHHAFGGCVVGRTAGIHQPVNEFRHRAEFLQSFYGHLSVFSLILEFLTPFLSRKCKVFPVRFVSGSFIFR